MSARTEWHDLDSALAYVVDAAQERTFDVHPQLLEDGHTVVVAHHEHVKLHVSTLGKRPAARHSFADLDSLAAWLLRSAGDHALVADVLVSESRTVAHIDPDDPASDLVVVPMVHHPRFARWVRVLGKPLSQREFMRLLIAARADFPTEYAKDRAGDVRAVGTEGERLAAEVGKISIARITNWKSEIDKSGVTTLAAADATTTVNAKIPSELNILVPWFIGVKAGDGAGGLLDFDQVYSITLDVDVNADGKDGPEFTLTFPAYAEVQLQATRDAAEHLHRRLNVEPHPDTGPWLVVLGTHATADVPIIRPRIEGMRPWVPGGVSDSTAAETPAGTSVPASD